MTLPSSGSISIGYYAGNSVQGTGSVAIGRQSGQNNQGANSTVSPNFAEVDSNDEVYQTSDGYIWKYMYSVDTANNTKFTWLLSRLNAFLIFFLIIYYY